MESRLECLNDNMNKFIENDKKIHALDTAAFKDDSYFSKDFLSKSRKPFVWLKEKFYRNGII